MKFKAILANLTLLAVSVVVTLAISEVAARVVLDASDYLQVELVEDEILGAVPTVGTFGGGFDDWGFRNRDVPISSEIVALGDSHTYGNTARMDESWPYVLGRLSHRQVYNMGLGGYGPNQYFHLFTTKALKLKPHVVICGLYMGDDFENAFRITYGLTHWSSLRTLALEGVDFDIWEVPVAPTWHKRLRIWLSRNSVIYQLVFHGSLLGGLKGEVQIRNADAIYDSVAVLSVPEKNILEAFFPKPMLARLDQGSKTVREGMRITFELLASMNEMSRQNNIEFVVVVIPTKELVFEEYLKRNRDIALGDVIDRLLINERLARDTVFRFFDDSNIEFVDTLPALSRHAEEQLYARTPTDVHPNRNGYRIIGEAVFDALERKDRQATADSSGL